MTPEEKIAALVEHIKKEFPNGCEEVRDCNKCPLYNAEKDTINESVCNILLWTALKLD